MVTCSSCHKNVANETGTTTFDCPKCKKQKIVRCSHCRQIVVKYSCSACNFEGPN